jgi:transposase
MAKPLVPDTLWEFCAPFLPPEPPKPQGGRPRMPDRAALTGMLFVLKAGIPWELLPHELGCGSGMPCWRRLRDWHHAGVWHQRHPRLVAPLRAADQID